MGILLVLDVDRLIKSDEMWIFTNIHIFELHDMTTFTIPLKYFFFLWKCLSQHKVKSGMAC